MTNEQDKFLHSAASLPQVIDQADRFFDLLSKHKDDLVYRYPDHYFHLVRSKYDKEYNLVADNDTLYRKFVIPTYNAAGAELRIAIYSIALFGKNGKFAEDDTVPVDFLDSSKKLKSQKIYRFTLDKQLHSRWEDCMSEEVFTLEEIVNEWIGVLKS